MATVYLARDLKHDRQVALKVLNPELGAVLGADRFLAEIKVTANLQHPNLLPLFDSGDADGLLFYVMPYIEGESLRARLDREQQLPVDEAVRISVAIASALDYAHRHGVIHRDLKPENILLHEGQPLVADFGIALAVSAAGGARMTHTGLSLGTPQYMSPEQATGDRVVDGRSDIYSLGAITYEMLVGDPPYVASTSQGLIAKLLTEKPSSVRVLRPNVPSQVEATVARALEKLPADRFSTAAEFAESLEGKAVGTTRYQTGTTAVTNRRIRFREAAALATVVILSSLLLWQLAKKASPAEAPVIRANFDLPPNIHFNDALAGNTLTVSPDGEMVAFSVTDANAYQAIYVRRINELTAHEITNRVGRNLGFSPDGRWLAFTEGNELLKVSVDGGEVIKIADTGVPYVSGLDWSLDGTIYIGSFGALWSIPANGGKLTMVSGNDSNDQSNGKRWPVVLPGGKAIAYARGNSPFPPSRLEIIDLTDHRAAEFDIQISAPLGAVGDQLVYVTPSGGIMAMRFDFRSLRPLGDPVQLDDGVLTEATAGAKAALSASGTLIYLRGRAQFQPVLVAPGSTSATPLFKDAGAYSSPRFSPDGSQVATTVFGSNATDIWVYNIRLNTFTRLTAEGVNLRAEWSADGRYVIFVSKRDGRTGIWRQAVDGSSPAELLYQPDVEIFETLMSPDMKWLLYRTAPGAKNSRDIFAVPLTGERKVLPLVTGPDAQTQPRLSPDGKWLAYQSNEGGRFEIYVRPFPQNGARIQVSDNGGTEPIWARSGNSLYYRGTSGEMNQVGVTTDSRFSIGERKVVLTGDYLTDASHAAYDVAPDGRLLMLKRAGAESQTIIVHNWGREVREKTSRR